jgi:hypothetical protein
VARSRQRFESSPRCDEIPIRIWYWLAWSLITGNEDGIKHCSMNIVYSLRHLGFAIPPRADAGWIGEAGPVRCSLPKSHPRSTTAMGH